jgi:MFS family permease
MGAEGAGKLNLIEAVRTVLTQAPIRNAMIGNMISTGVTYALTLWSVSFFSRTFGIKPHTGAGYTGLVFVVQGIAAFASGPIVDKIAKGRSRTIALFPAIGCAASVPAGLIMLFSPTIGGSLFGFALFMALLGLVIPPGNLLLLRVTPSNARGSSVAIGKLVSILIGSGILSWLTGMLSDQLGPHTGLRWGLFATLLLNLIGAVFFYRSGRAKGAGETQVLG